MRIGIVAVGSELLTPFFQDTDSLYLTKRINDLGLEVGFKIIVGDDPENLRVILKDSIEKSDLLFIVGGLGPTEDDRTREVLAEVLGRKLIFRPDLLQAIEERFCRRGLAMPESNRRQAYILEGAEPLPNLQGTAPGEWLEEGEKRIVVLPGPPQELQPMFEDSVWPRLQPLRRGFLHRQVLKITGLTESQVEELIRDLYPRSPDLRVTLLAYPGQIEIHLRSASDSEIKAQERLNPLVEALLNRLGDNVFSHSGEELEEVVGKLLRLRGKTLAVAESCSGGLVSHRLTAVPGSSDYFLEGIVAYSNEAKISLLGVPRKMIQKHGAVSPEVAGAMAEAVRHHAGSDFGLSTTGIAGPGGGTPVKPVGLVYTGLATDSGTEVSRNLFLGSRDQIKFQTSQKALDMLRRHLLGRSEEGK